jgi:hypothetical protein
MQTVRIRPAPVLLIVSKSPAFIRRCGDVAIQVQSVVVEATEHSFATLATQTRALAVVMTDATYTKDPDHFTAMAKQAGTRLVTIPDEKIPQSDLETRILSAITAAESENRDFRR